MKLTDKLAVLALVVALELQILNLKHALSTQQELLGKVVQFLVTVFGGQQ